MIKRAQELTNQAEVTFDRLLAEDYNWIPTPDITRQNLYASGACLLFSWEFKAAVDTATIARPDYINRNGHRFIKTEDGFLVDGTYLQYSKPFYKLRPLPPTIKIPNQAPKILVARTLAEVEATLKKAEILEPFWPFWLSQLTDKS